MRVVIRNLGITARSPIEARRIADAIRPALERALARVALEAPRPAGRQSPVDRLATQIADVVDARLRGAS
jgi:hypothetical protein